MWAGNTSYIVDNRGRQIIASIYPGAGSDADNTKARVLNALGNDSHNPAFIGGSVTNVYDQNDVNLDGKIRYPSATYPSDVDIIANNVMNWPDNILRSGSFANCTEELP